MKILVINCGSSSIKYQLFEMPECDTLLKGIVERIGLNDTIFRFTIHKNNKEIRKYLQVNTHKEGIDLILSALICKEYNLLNRLSEIIAVGHRVAHGGEKFRHSVVLNNENIEHIEKLSELAPLHNPPALTGIRIMQEKLAGAIQIASFDTSFHGTIPEYAYLYPLPYSFYSEHHIRRYGFHGNSHAYVTAKAYEFLGSNLPKRRIISCHLGNGSSVTAIFDGKSVDTSMGLTPLEGVMMGTRTGDLDPGVVAYIARKLHFSPEEIDNLLYKKSGLLGITGISSDIREIIKQADKGSKQAKLGLEMFCYRLKKYIGAYAAVMNGLDILIFTGGIGENSPQIRKKTCEDLDFLGIDMDNIKNEEKTEDCKLISSPHSKVRILVIPTKEELLIAQETYGLVNVNQS